MVDKGLAVLIPIGFLALVAPAATAEPTPDLAVEQLLGPYRGGVQIREGANVTFAAWIQNHGANTTYERAVPVRFMMDNVTFAEGSLGRLVEDGRTLVRSAPWKATPGRHQVQAVVDAEQTVPDADPANNRAAFEFSVEGKDEPAVAVDAPDLRVQSLATFNSCYGDDANVYRRYPIRVNATIVYSGWQVDSERVVNVTLIVDGAAILQKDLTLGFGQPVNVTAWSRGLDEHGAHDYAAVVNATSGDVYVENDYRTGRVQVDSYGRPCMPTAPPTRTSTTTSMPPATEPASVPSPSPIAAFVALLLALLAPRANRSRR